MYFFDKRQKILVDLHRYDRFYINHMDVYGKREKRTETKELIYSGKSFEDATEFLTAIAESKLNVYEYKNKTLIKREKKE